MWSAAERVPKWNSGLRTAQSNHSHVTKDLIQTITSTQSSSRTYRSISSRYQRLWHPIWCPKMTPGYGDSPGAIHSPYLISQPFVHPDRPWQTYDINWKKCFFQTESTVIPAPLWNSCAGSLAKRGLAKLTMKRTNSTGIKIYLLINVLYFFSMCLKRLLPLLLLQKPLSLMTA